MLHSKPDWNIWAHLLKTVMSEHINIKIFSVEDLIHAVSNDSSLTEFETIIASACDKTNFKNTLAASSSYNGVVCEKVYTTLITVINGDKEKRDILYDLGLMIDSRPMSIFNPETLPW